jgi:Ni/Fe-hydrogenase subunit HybB-like protein
MAAQYRNWIKDGLWALAIAGMAAAVLRFTFGLGASTGLNDTTPWGLWIAFKLCFVALSGGGFTLAAMVYVFHLESFRPILRRAILLALLGYGSFIVSLLFDLGLPWHIYMPIIHWQHHSVMFEIAWCVMLYFTVLTLEFAPVILEHDWFRHPIFQMIYRALHVAVIPLVITGIVLSTLHQSSLGALILIMPHRVHPLWYSPWIPVLFFISAIAAGLMALVLEGFLVERWLGSQVKLDLLERLGKVAAFALALYLALRLGDLWARGTLPAALDGSWQSLLFGAEVLIGGLLPLTLLTSRKIRQTREGLLTSALLIVAGVVSQRMSLSLFTMWRPAPYLPSLAEILIALGVPAAAALIYLFFVENLAVLDEKAPLKIAPARVQLPMTWPFPFAERNSLNGIIAHRSGLAVGIIAVMLAVLPIQTAASGALPLNLVQPARGWRILWIDGNRAKYQVEFAHAEHQERLAKEMGSSEEACQTCHHLNLPQDEATACWQCHRDYLQAVNIFDHTRHQQILGGNAACQECHTVEHTRRSAAACQECHETMSPKEGQAAFNPMAPAYLDAMHGLCQDCHAQQAAAQNRPELALCKTCHSLQENPSELQAAIRNE